MKETEQQRDREVGVGWKERDGNSERGREGQKNEDGRHRKTQREKERKRHGETAETHLKRIFRQSLLKARTKPKRQWYEQAREGGCPCPLRIPSH